MFRRKPKPDPPPAPVEVPERWRAKIDDILRLGAELNRLTAATPDGPVRERMQDFSSEFHSNYGLIVGVAARGVALIRLTETLDFEDITAAYKRARRDNAPEADDLGRQHASAQRLLNSLDDLDAHIAAASLRVRELVLAAGELSITGSESALEDAQRSLSLLAGEATALNAAMRTLQ